MKLEVYIHRTEMSIVRWMCELLKERKNNADLTELLGLEPVSSLLLYLTCGVDVSASVPVLIV